MKWFRYVKTVRKEINIIVIFFFVIWIIKVFWLNSISAPFSCFPKIGNIVETLCSSIVASYVFYLVVIHLKEEQDRENVNPYISKRIDDIIRVCDTQLLGFENYPTSVAANKKTLKLETLTKDDIDEVFKHKNPSERKAPASTGVVLADDQFEKANWGEYIALLNKKIQSYIDDLLKHTPLLDSELFKLLVDIEESIGSRSMLSHIDFSLDDLTRYSSSFFDYCVLIRKLKAYKKTKLAEYSEAK